MPICPKCGSQQPHSTAFCDKCGARLGESRPPSAASRQPASIATATTCPACGASAMPDWVFCDHCGTVLGPAVPTPAPANPLICSSCGAPLSPGSKFCEICGAGAGGGERGGRARLVMQGSDAVLPFPPDMSEVIIGRKDPVHSVFPDIDLSDHGGGEAGVSRQHARTFVQGSQVFIEDLSSTNHTYVNQQVLTPGQPHPLRDGDEVRLGRLKFNFYCS